MARSIHQLSSAKLKIKTPGKYADGGGLYLQVTLGAQQQVRRSWVFRFATNGNERFMGLGSCSDVSLAEARKAATDARKLLAAGRDPIIERDSLRTARAVANAKAMTFDQCAEAYMVAHRAGWRNPKHAAQWRTTLDSYASPIFGSLPVTAIDVGLVMKAIEPIWSDRTETANRLRGRIETVLNWATTHGLRTGDNPARWRGHLENLLPRLSKIAPVKHFAAMPYDKVAAFMTELRRQDGVAPLALQFTILTAGRTEQTLGATWDELDLNNRLWLVPGHRMKSGKDHRVPLSDAAMAILSRMAAGKQGRYVFWSNRSDRLSTMTMLKLLRRMGCDGLTVHGFRSSFRDWAAERTGYPNELCEMALAHVVGDKVEAAYRRGDLFEKRRHMMATWAEFATTQQPAADVIALRG